MRPQILFGLAFFGAIFLPDAAHAQVSGHAALSTSDTVRVSWTASGHGVLRHEGVVVEAGADAILLETSEGMRAIPAEAVTAVEYGHQRSGWEGFQRGFTVGAVVFGFAGAALGAVCGDFCFDDALTGAIVMGSSAGFAGGLVGGLLKSAAPGVEWRDAPVRATAGPAPGGGAAVGLRVSF